MLWLDYALHLSPFGLGGVGQPTVGLRTCDSRHGYSFCKSDHQPRMPPQLAAVLCAGFILWLFRRDSRIAGPMSWGLWVPLIWITIIASRPVGYWFVSGADADAAAGGDGGTGFVDRNTYLFLIICGLIVLARRRIDWGALLAQSRILWIFYAFLLLSVVWSEFPFIAFKRWFKEFGNLVMIWIILTEPAPVAAIRAVFIRCAFVLIPVSVLFIKYYPEFGRYTHRWTYETIYCGVTTNKNSLGVLAMIAGLFSLWQIVETYKNSGVEAKLGRLLHKAWPELLVFLMCLWLLNLAGSATAFSCFILCAIIYLASYRAWFCKNLKNLGLCVFLISSFLLTFSVSPGFRTVVADVLGRDATLTGRTVIWEEVLKLNTNPLIGSGFASTWLTPRGYKLAQELKIPHAHNGYLETYLNSGWIGVCLLFAVLLIAGRKASELLSGNPKVGRLFIAFFLGGIIYNYTEVAYLSMNIIGFGLWLIAAYAVSPEENEAFTAEADAVSGSFQGDFSDDLGDLSKEPARGNWS